MDRLLQLKALLKTERDDDFREYTEMFSRNNISHRKKNGVTWHPVAIVNSEIGLGEYLTLEIERTTNHNESHQFSPGKNVTLFTSLYADEKPVSATVKSVSGNKMRIVTTVDELPDWTGDGKLGINLDFDETSYREMDFALDKVISASGNRLAELRDIIYNGISPSFHLKESNFQDEALNDSQNEAVRKILSAKDIAIVHGPPGTGKTTTLVKAIAEVLKTEKQVLVCSPSNTAVDLLTEKLHRTGLHVLRLGNPVRISEDVLMNTLDAKIAAHESSKELKVLRKKAEEYFRMAGKYKRVLGREEKEQRQLLYREAKKIIQEARDLEDYILNDELENAQVVACTPVVSAGRLLRNRQFTSLFIDEAAQALEPMCWIPMCRSNRIILAGDHFQLPPTVKSKNAEALKETLFERVATREHVSVMLNVQYRMNENIMQFSNQQFYNNELHAEGSVRTHALDKNSDDALLNTALTFIDTAGCGYNDILNPESVSTKNPDEAALLIRHMKLLLGNYYTDKNKTSVSVGIISPYKEQTEYIGELLNADEEFRQFPSRISIKTIDGFQGQERDIIYISLVRSNDNREIGFLSDTRRMNVALTRAKKKLVVIGDSSTLANHPFYKSFIDYAESINSYVSAWEFIE